MGEFVIIFYREEGWRVKLRVEKKLYSFLEFSVWYNFKVSFVEFVCFFLMRFVILYKMSCYYFFCLLF